MPSTACMKRKSKRTTTRPTAQTLKTTQTRYDGPPVCPPTPPPPSLSPALLCIFRTANPSPQSPTSPTPFSRLPGTKCGLDLWDETCSCHAKHPFAACSLHQMQHALRGNIARVWPHRHPVLSLVASACCSVVRLAGRGAVLLRHCQGPTPSSCCSEAPGDEGIQWSG